MPSPFPGMDPYLEPHWLDVHTKLVAYAADELNRVLPDALVARTEERVAVESAWGDERVVGPDVRVFAPGAAAAAGAGATPAVAGATGATPSGVVVGTPYKLVVEMEPITERFVRILDESGRLITVIEFISPTNKRGEGLEAYLSKRRELLEGGVHLVEIDLVRQGNWRALLRPHVCPPEAVTAYWVTVRHPPGSVAYLYAAPLASRLPDVRVPLRPEDPPAVLPLQQLVEQVYANGRYGRTIDYRQPLDPPLPPEDAAWAERLLRDAGGHQPSHQLP